MGQQVLWQWRAQEPLSARLSWQEVHRLEVMVRMRASSLSKRQGSDACTACGEPLGDDRMRLAGVLVHPGCLPWAVRR